MKTHIILRRIHLYIGLFLFIFFIRYGISAIPFSHNSYFNQLYNDQPQWIKQNEMVYNLNVPEDANIREVGKQILTDTGLNGAFGAYKANQNQINVHRYSFFSTKRLVYFIDKQLLVVENKKFRWDHFLQQFHWRGGFLQDSLLHDTWGIMVDAVCIGIILWIITGLYMWWKIHSARKWGIIAILCGFMVFIFFVIVL